MENSRPQYSKPVIVDLDDRDQFAASGGCNTGSNPQGGQCHPTGGVANNRCAYGWLANTCAEGTFVY
jgi:hypothetical protein